MNTKWTKETIKDKLLTDDRWLARGVIAIYHKQTADEKNAETTKHNNNRGFTGADAKFLTSLATQLIRNRDKGLPIERSITPKQVFVARRRMVKYAGQLAKIANGKI